MDKEYVKQNIRLYVVVAAYNEAEMIGEVINKLQQITNNIIVVDDGSQDETSVIATTARCIVMRHETNLGQGAAIRSGIQRALAENAEYIATFDADGQHDVNDLYKMLVEVIKQKKDVGLGSRFLGSAPGIPIKRVFLLKVGILFTYLFSGRMLTDVHNGLRVFTNYAAKRIDLSTNGMSHASIIVHSIVKQKLEYIEYPVQITYTKYSKMKGQRLMDIIKTAVYLITLKKITYKTRDLADETGGK